MQHLSFFDRCPINVNGSWPSVLSIYSVILSVYGDLVSCQLFYVCVPGFPVNKVITLIIEDKLIQLCYLTHSASVYYAPQLHLS